MSRSSMFPVGSLVVSKEKRRRGKILFCGYVVDKGTGVKRFEITVMVFGETYYVHSWKTFNQIWESPPRIIPERKHLETRNAKHQKVHRVHKG